MTLKRYAWFMKDVFEEGWCRHVWWDIHGERSPPPPLLKAGGCILHRLQTNIMITNGAIFPLKSVLTISRTSFHFFSLVFSIEWHIAIVALKFTTECTMYILDIALHHTLWCNQLYSDTTYTYVFYICVGNANLCQALTSFRWRITRSWKSRCKQVRVSTAIDKVPNFNTSLGFTFIEDIDHFEEELFEREELAKATYNSAQMFTQLNELGSFFLAFLYCETHLQLTNISEKCLGFGLIMLKKFWYLDRENYWNLSLSAFSRSSSSTTQPVRWPWLWKRSKLLNKSSFLRQGHRFQDQVNRSFAVVGWTSAKH